MSSEASADRPTHQPPSSSPDDAFLVQSMLGGDSSALGKLIDRYDRLVRYVIFRGSKARCMRDPEWIESIASTTWEGFVGSMRRDRDTLPSSIRGYLVRIARNQTVSALRQAPPPSGSVNGESDSEASFIAATLEDPSETVARLELLEALRTCLAGLDAEDRHLASQLAAITDRRWKEASGVLGLSESTLRSRWAQTLGRLKKCLNRKTGERFAPE